MRVAVRSLSLASSVCLLAGAWPSRAQQPNVGIVDLQRALSTVREGKAAREQLKAERDKLQAQLTADQARYLTDKTVFEKQSASLSEGERAKRFADVQRSLAALQKKVAEFQSQMTAKEQVEVKRIFDRMEPLLTRIAKAHRLSFVLNQSDSGVIASLPALDFTDELIRLSDATGDISPLAADASRVEVSAAYVDLNRALHEVADGKAAQKRLKEEFSRTQQQLDADQAQLKEDKAAFDQESARLSESERTQRRTALERRATALSQLFEKAQRVLTERERAETASLIAKMDPILTNLARDRGYGLVFEKTDSGLAFAPPDLDLTNELIRLFERGGQGTSHKASVGTAQSLISYVDLAKVTGSSQSPATLAAAKAATERVLRAQPLAIILDKKGLVFARQSLDRTAEVQRELATPSAVTAEQPPAATVVEPSPTPPSPATPPGSASPSGTAVASTLDKAPVTRMKQDDAYALVVGVENYRGQLPPAESAENDAAVFSRYLVRTLGVPEDHIKSLLGNGASKSDIDSAVDEWLPSTTAKPGSTVYFFFSGHGAPDPTTGESYLMPWDGDPAYLKSKAVRLRDLYSRLASLKGRRVLAFVDACFSGTGARSVIPKGLRPLVALKSVEVPKGVFASLSASGPAETSGPSATERHGLFTEQLLRGISGLADRDGDHVVTMHELNLFVRNQVRNAARAQNRSQTPELSLSGVKDPGDWAVVEGLVDE